MNVAFAITLDALAFWGVGCSRKVSLLSVMELREPINRPIYRFTTRSTRHFLQPRRQAFADLGDDMIGDLVGVISAR